MLKLYICSKCKAFRYVSKKNITCYKCNRKMTLAKIPYSQFIQLNEKARQACIEQACQDESVQP